MPRDGSGIYSIPPGTHGITNTQISSSAYNTYVDDVAQDLNVPRPIVAGGTAASTASAAIANLGGVSKTGDTMTGALGVGVFGTNVTVGAGSAGGYALSVTGSITTGQSNGLAISAGSSTSDSAILVTNKSGATTFDLDGLGSAVFANNVSARGGVYYMGASDNANIHFDGTYITFSNSPKASQFVFNSTNDIYADASNTYLRSGSPLVTILTINSGGTFTYGAIQTNVQGYKPGGGPWADNSDARIKTVTGDYTAGLAEVVALQPRRYVFKGNDTPDQAANSAAPYTNSAHFQAAVAGTEYTGLVAQEAESVMPELVTQRSGWIDGAKVTDLRIVDTGPLIYALINCCKELAARVEALESK